jgi:predicted O-linked N-acetylglucosamine transferase (SPINDLY family)
MTRRLQAEADHWHSISGKSDLEVVELIRGDKIDILVDLGGHTGESRLLVFAYKPSPVQVAWLGYPNTTGLRTMDYRLTDAIADPPGEADSFHSEKLIRLEYGFLCYQADEYAPETDSPPCLERGHVTFGSFNNLAKLNPEVIKVWAEILRGQPRSRLMLKAQALTDEGNRKRFLRMFAEHGIAADRLDLHGWMPVQKDHLELYREIDIGLDPFPYNGTTTTCEALWMGVPVVAILGDRHAARVGASIMHQVGIEELVAKSTEEYVGLAVGLANDLDRLTVYRNSLRERMRQSKLMDQKLFTTVLEKAYKQIWSQWCQEQRKLGR